MCVCLVTQSMLINKSLFVWGAHQDHWTTSLPSLPCRLHFSPRPLPVPPATNILHLCVTPILGMSPSASQERLALVRRASLLPDRLITFQMVNCYFTPTRLSFQIGKGVHQGCILSPCLFNFYAEYIVRNAGLKEAQLESRPGEISITSDMQMTPPLWQKVKRNSKAS